MRLLADENFPRPAVTALRERGHDVRWIAEGGRGMRDEAVAELAARETRVLLTLDKDFGELAFRAGLPAAAGIVLFRLSPPTLNALVAAAVAFFDATPDCAGEFTVIENDRARRRKLPPV